MTKLFTGGVPTEPDVRKLVEAFADLKEDQVIEHDAIERVISIDRKASRYRVVVDAWRSRLRRMHNVDMIAVPGVGYRVLDAIGRVRQSVRDYGIGARRIGRSVQRIKAVPLERLDHEQQRVAEHVRRHMEVTLAQARADSKAIAVVFTPQAALPRRTGGGK